MNENLKDILNNLSPEVSQETLLQYLQKQLTPAEEHAVEAALSEDPFATEALEGLTALNHEADLEKISESLKKSLSNQLKEKRKKKDAIGTFLQPWLVYTIIIILLLCIVAYFVIKKLQH